MFDDSEAAKGPAPELDAAQEVFVQATRGVHW